MASSTSTAATTARVLLLSPPSVASHPSRLEAVRAAHDRAHTDIQMLDRLALGLVSLPSMTYDTVLLLSDASADDSSNGSSSSASHSKSPPHSPRAESQRLLDRAVLAAVIASLRPGGSLTSQDGTYASEQYPEERREAILAGLSVEYAQVGKGATKLDNIAAEAVPLRRKRDKMDGGAVAVTSAVGTGATVPTEMPGMNGHGNGVANGGAPPAGVGFVDFSDDLDAPVDSDEELIDEDTLLDESDLTRPVIQPPECRPKPGKRRRACKDCTCGLAAKLEAEDMSRRTKADADLKTLQSSNPTSKPPGAAILSAADLDDAEVDFTVQGKVGSCGSCALGDAFRCDGCVGSPQAKRALFRAAFLA